ncbi:hypothetical protein LCGC14_1707640 [marine sediment metagenome]|uniref:Uncharacterized protein n=1 Tax=marine sediment metagenome TaxID=412755 RepID=A0A0F9HFQ0_9ZZZZ|nr:hypothetical protein [bacterium]
MNGTNIVINGWSHVLWQIQKGEGEKINGLGCKVFGFEECHLRYWKRSTLPGPRNNKILYYRAIYVPRPVGMEALYHTLNEDRINMNSFEYWFSNWVFWKLGVVFQKIQL